MKMKIESLKLQNFKCHRSLSMDFGKVTTISGKNELGKSSIFDAFSFLFFGKSSTGVSDADAFKPVVNGKRLEAVDVVVSAVVNGVEYQRTLHERWKRSKGSIAESFDGNEHLFEINGVTVLKKDFEAKVKEAIGSPDLFVLLSDVHAFANMHWQKRRDVLLGDGDSLEMKSNKLSELKASKTKLNKLVDGLPIRIDEQYNSLVDADGDFSLAEHTKLSDAMNKAVEDRAISLNGGSSSVLKEQLLTLKEALMPLKTKASGEVSQKILSFQQQEQDERASKKDIELTKYNLANGNRSELVGRKSTLENDKRINVTNVEDSQRKVDTITVEIAGYRESWDTVNAEVFAGDDTCHACGQSLPAETLSSAQESFNLDKANRLENIVSSSQGAKARLEVAEMALIKWKKALDENNVDLDSIVIADEVPLVQIDTVAIASKYTPLIEGATATDETLAEIAEVEGLIALKEKEIDENKPADSTKMDEEIEKLTAEFEALESAKKVFDSNAIINARIGEIRAEQKVEQKKLVKIEGEIAGLEQSILEDVQAIEEKINKMFKFTKFKLFDVQINGGIKPTCTPMVDGVEYPSLNYAKKINVGIDIINTLSEMKGLSYPLWCDNAESVNKLETPSGQLIRMVVTDGEKLKIEVNHE